MRKLILFLFTLLLPITANAVTCSAGYYLVQNVPAGYTELEYIESTGTQYIDTGVPVDDYNSFKISLKLTDDGMNVCYGYIISQNNNSLRNCKHGITWFSKNHHYIIEEDGTFQDIECGYEYMRLNGTNISGSADHDDAMGTTVTLFAANTTVSNFALVQVKMFQIWDPNGTLVRNFIPARRNSDGVLGLYDTVTDTFFTNSGTGTFVAGADTGTCEPCPAGYYCTGGIQTKCSGRGPNRRLTYSNAGASSCTECPAVQSSLEGRMIVYSGWWPNDIHSYIDGCSAYFNSDTPDATFTILCYYNSTDGIYGGPNVRCEPHAPTACAAGKYNIIDQYSTWNGSYMYCYGMDCGNNLVCGDVGVGYYSPDGDTARYACDTKPANSHFTCSGTTNDHPWECDTTYTEYSGACHAMCSASGMSTLRAGTYSYPLFADKTNVPSPVLHIKNSNDVVCYVYMEADTGGEHGLKVRYNDITYHAIDPR